MAANNFEQRLGNRWCVPVCRTHECEQDGSLFTPKASEHAEPDH